MISPSHAADSKNCAKPIFPPSFLSYRVIFIALRRLYRNRTHSARLESGNSPRSSALEVPYRTYYLSNRTYISWPSRRPAAARGQCQCRGTTERRRATLRLRLRSSSSGGGPSSPSPPRPPRRRRRGRHRRHRTSWRDSSTCPPSGPRGRRRRATASCGRASPGPSRASSRPLPAPARVTTRARTKTRIRIAASGDASGPASSTTADAPRLRRRSTPRRVSYELQSLCSVRLVKRWGPLRRVLLACSCLLFWV